MFFTVRLSNFLINSFVKFASIRQFSVFHFRYDRIQSKEQNRHTYVQFSVPTMSYGKDKDYRTD